jgi:hypothetical protein
MPLPIIPVLVGLSALGVTIPFLVMGGKKKPKKKQALPDADPVLAEVEAEIEGDAVIVADPFGQVGAVDPAQLPDEPESWALPANWRAYFTLKPVGVTQAQLKAAVAAGADLSDVSLVSPNYVRFLAFDEEPMTVAVGQAFPGLPGVLVDVEELLTVPELEEDAEAADDLLAEVEADDDDGEDIDDAAEALAEEDAAEAEELKEEVAQDAPPGVINVAPVQDAEAAGDLLAEVEADDDDGEDIDDAAEALAEEDAAEAEELKEEVAQDAPPTGPAAGTLALARLLLDAERRTGWKTAHQEQVGSWQAASGLEPDSRFGPVSALRMAAEVGVAPIVRFWPKDAWGVGSAPYVAYIAALRELGVDSNRERGQAFGSPPKPITTFAQV